MDPKLLAYINNSLNQGISRQEIEVQLLKIGWLKPQIDQAFQEKNVPRTEINPSVLQNFKITDNVGTKPKKFFSKLKLILMTSITIVVVVVVLLITFPQIQIAVFNKYYFSESKTPQVYQVLENRTIHPLANNLLTGVEFSDFGIKLRFPWNNIVKKDQPIGNDGTVLFYKWEFAGNKVVSIIRPLNVNYVHEFIGNNSNDAAKVKDFFGDNTLNSNYEFMKVIYSSSPKDISLFKSKNEMLAKDILLILKKAMIGAHKGNDGIFNFETDNIKGFQFGIPGKTERVDVQFFDKNDKEHVMLFSGVTQDEIDDILSSIK